MDAAVCVETLHAWRRRRSAFRAALEKLFPPDMEGVELACDADFAVKAPARMRAKVDEYRRENETVWPREATQRLPPRVGRHGRRGAPQASRRSRTAARSRSFADERVAAYEALWTAARSRSCVKNQVGSNTQAVCMGVEFEFPGARPGRDDGRGPDRPEGHLQRPEDVASIARSRARTATPRTGAWPRRTAMTTTTTTRTSRATRRIWGS